MKLRKKDIIFLIGNLILLLFYLISSKVCIDNYNAIHNWKNVVGIFLLIQLFIHLVEIIYFKIRFIDFRVMFILFCYLFIFGRIYLYAFTDGSFIFWDLEKNYTSLNMLSMGMYGLCGIQSLFLGFFIKNRDNFNNLERIIKEISDNKSNLLFYIGVFCFIVGLIATLYTDYTKIISTQTINSYRNLELDIGLIDDLAILYLSGTIMIIWSNYLSKKSQIIFITTILIYNLVVMMLSGDRRYQMSAVIMLLVLIMYKYDFKFNVFKLILFGLITLIILNLLYIIREFRDGELSNILMYVFSNLDQLFSLNALYETLSEFGLSFYSLCNVGKYIPSYFSFQYGYTFVVSLTAILPLGLMNSSFFESASYSNIINNIEGSHVGATVLGDFYINFGWFSIPLLILFGYLIYKIMYTSYNKNKQWMIIKFFILFYIFISLPRATISQTIRMIFIGVFIPYFLCTIFRRRIK